MASTRKGHPGWLLTTLLGGMALGNVDIAIVNIAAPSIRSGLAATGGELELVVSGYTLAYALLLITSARLGDLRGYRRMFVLGLAGFTLASLLCGFAPDAAWLVVARIVQGAGAALMAAQVLTGIQLNFDGQARTRALGWYAAVLSGSAVVGQVLGGVLVSANLFDAGWRPIFLINAPAGVVLLVIALRFVPAGEPRPARRLDLGGVAALSAALLLLVVPLVLGRDEGWPMWTWVCLAASLPAFAGFVAWQRRVVARGGSPLIDLGMLTRPTIALGMLSQAIARSTYFAILFVLALYLQQGLGASAVYSGLALVSWVAAFGVAGPLLTRLAGRDTWWVASAGAVVLAVGFAGIGAGLLAGTTNGIVLVICLGIGGLGYGASFSGMLAHLTDIVPSHQAADLSGVFNTVLQVGGAIGVAAFGTGYLALAPGPGRGPAIHGFTVITLALAATALVAGSLAWRSIRARTVDYATA